MKIWNKIVLGNEEGLNIVVESVVLKRTWIEDENIVVTKDQPKMDQIEEEDSDNNDENFWEQSVLV